MAGWRRRKERNRGGCVLGATGQGRTRRVELGKTLAFRQKAVAGTLLRGV